jgi:hypothetical protein
MWLEGVAIVLAAAAFIVAMLGLYLTNLKRAEIRVAEIPGSPPHVWAENWSEVKDVGRWPGSPWLYIPLLVYNVGARAGILTRVSLARLDEVPNTNPLFVKLDLPVMLIGDNIAIEAGAVLPHPTIGPGLRIGFPLGTTSENVETLKARLDQKRELRIRVAYRYLKGRSLLPWRWDRPVTVDKHLDFVIPLEAFAANVRRVGPG